MSLVKSNSLTDREDRALEFEPQLTDEVKQQLRAPIRRIRRLMENTRKKVLEAYFEIGKIVYEALDQLEFGDLFGRRALAHFAKSVDVDPTTINNCLRLVVDWGEDEFASIVAHQRIGWGHVVLLLSVKTAEERADLAAKVDAENWSAADLGHEILAKYGLRRPGSGRRPAIPRNVKQALGRLLGLATKTHNAMSEALFCTGFDLATELSYLPDTSVTPELREHVAIALEALKQLSADLAEAAPRLERALPLLDHAITNKAIQQETSKEEK